MNEKIEDIVDKVIDGADELNDYLDKQVKDTLKTIISTMFEIHAYSDDPVRVFFMTDIVVMTHILNLLGRYQDAVIECLKTHGIVADFTMFKEERERMK